MNAPICSLFLPPPTAVASRTSPDVPPGGPGRPIERNPEPVPLDVPPGAGFYCHGGPTTASASSTTPWFVFNPWEDVILYRWMGWRRVPRCSAPPLALRRLWYYTVSPEDASDPPRFLFHSDGLFFFPVWPPQKQQARYNLPRINARLLRTNADPFFFADRTHKKMARRGHHRATDLIWNAHPCVSLGMTAAPDVRLRLLRPPDPVPSARRDADPVLVAVGSLWWERSPERTHRWWTILPYHRERTPSALPAHPASDEEDQGDHNQASF